MKIVPISLIYFSILFNISFITINIKVINLLTVSISMVDFYHDIFIYITFI